MAAIEISNLVKQYHQGEPNVITALDSISLGIQPGEFVSVVGRAGSGKTTLLHCLGLLLRPTSGQIVIDGLDTIAMSDGSRAEFRGRRIGFVPRARHLLPSLSALENVMLPLRYSRLGRGGRRQAAELLDQVGLGDSLDRRPDQLTSGDVQRVAIARALVRAPSIVLADEPTGEVGDESSDELLFLMQQINRTSGVTFVIATQDVEVGSCMDRMVRLRDGRISSDEWPHLVKGRRRGIGS